MEGSSRTFQLRTHKRGAYKILSKSSTEEIMLQGLVIHSTNLSIMTTSLGSYLLRIGHQITAPLLSHLRDLGLHVSKIGVI
jgi:hypothetical protein